jgi:hypothetical protein
LTPPFKAFFPSIVDFHGGGEVKKLTLIFWLCLGATPVFAQTAPCPTAAGCGYHGAPAPLLGLGIPSALAVGGILLGAKLFSRWRR